MAPVAPGLGYHKSFISEQDAQELLQNIDQKIWSNELKRRVQHYGYRYDYKARSISASARIADIPAWLQPLCHRLHAEEHFKQLPDQVIVNEYEAGQGIASHIDCVPCFGAVIASLSLNSACVMDFTQPETQQKSSLLLEPRSLLVLSGDARYHWQHGIAHRKRDHINGIVVNRGRRVSLTFRTMIIKDS